VIGFTASWPAMLKPDQPNSYSRLTGSRTRAVVHKGYLMNDLPSSRVVLARHATLDGEIQLQQRPLPDGSTAYEIISNGVFLMASYNHVSARALASQALDLETNDSPANQRVLIGGLGMGFTLQAALNYEAVIVDVVEISPYIIEWNQTHFGAINDEALADPRVTLIQNDLYTVLDSTPAAAYRAILLDVDNGPSWLNHPDNARLYTVSALKQWSTLLSDGGCFAVWSAQAEPTFLANLAMVFQRAEEVPVSVRLPEGQQVVYFIYLGICAAN
jgi:spermidine synthase